MTHRRRRSARVMTPKMTPKPDAIATQRSAAGVSLANQAE